jgi:hypothetical protein
MFAERPPPGCHPMFANAPFHCHPEASEGPCIQLNYLNNVFLVIAPENTVVNTRSLGGLGMTASGVRLQTWDDSYTGRLQTLDDNIFTLSQFHKIISISLVL